MLMENTPPSPESKLNSGKSGGVNLTVVIVAIVVCVSALACVALFTIGRQGTSSRGSAASAKPEIPAFITWRETKLPGQTQVARIWGKPDGQFPLRVIVQVESSVSGERREQETVLERRNIEEPLEIGFLQGHTFVPGDRISVGHRDYSPISSTCKPLK